MPSVFTTFATSRFVDQDAVVTELRGLARSLAASRPEVKAIYLFGSFATRTATPRSDADIAVVIADEAADVRAEVEGAAFDCFLAAPVPADLFVLSTTAAQGEHGVAGAVRREGLRLA